MTETEPKTYVTEITPGGPRPARPTVGTMLEPAREIPITHEADILVVGGGPAGTTAAIAAARLGARTLLVERYNHLGGLSTGGLVIWIDRMTDWDGKLVIQGIGRELLDRLPAAGMLGPRRADWGSQNPALVAQWKPRFSAHHDTVTWAPMIDPEQLKSVSLQAVREAGATLLFHAWASTAIREDGRVQGVVFESKRGRFAVRAHVVIDTTGDGDVFSSAGEGSAADVEAASIHQCVNTAWLWAGVDNERWLAFRRSSDFAGFTARAREELGLFESPMPGWRNDVALFLGPRWAGYDALDPVDLSEVELRSRDAMMALLAYYRRHAPGFADAWIVLSAPQTGVRQTRRLVGRKTMTREDWQRGVVHDDEIGVSPSLAPKFASVSVPYGSLLPRIAAGLLVAGRHLSSDASSHTFMREIPQCWLTGHAAGVAAALAVQSGVDPHALPLPQIQAALRTQGAYLQSPSASRKPEHAGQERAAIPV